MLFSIPPTATVGRCEFDYLLPFCAHRAEVTVHRCAKQTNAAAEAAMTTSEFELLAAVKFELEQLLIL